MKKHSKNTSEHHSEAASKLEQLQKQIDDLNAQLLRERADAMNVRRRAEEERMRLGSFYKALVVKEMLPAIDNFERAQAAAKRSSEQGTMSKEFADILKGMESIYRQFVGSLEKLGVEKIMTVGEHFDPTTMEAVTMDEGDGEHEIVSEELQSGYKIGDELIRPAMVRVKG